MKNEVDHWTNEYEQKLRKEERMAIHSNFLSSRSGTTYSAKSDGADLKYTVNSRLLSPDRKKMRPQSKSTAEPQKTVVLKSNINTGRRDSFNLPSAAFHEGSKVMPLFTSPRKSPISHTIRKGSSPPRTRPSTTAEQPAVSSSGYVSLVRVVPTLKMQQRQAQKQQQSSTQSKYL